MIRLVFLARLFYFLWRKDPVQRIDMKKMKWSRRAAIPQGAKISARPLAALCAGLAAMLLTLCGSVFAKQAGDAQAAPAARREITDEAGRKLKLPQEVDRVISLAPNLTEIVFALGDENHLAADTDYCDYPPEAARKPHVGGTVNPNLEEVAALMPDVILATSINRRETVAALDRLGFPVFITDPHSVDEMIATVEHIGAALGVEKSAGAVAGDLRSRLSDLDRRLSGAPARRVLFVVWTEPLISIGTRHVYRRCVAARRRPLRGGDENRVAARQPRGNCAVAAGSSGVCQRPRRRHTARDCVAAQPARLAKPEGDAAQRYRGDQRRDQSPRAADGGRY